jgi:toxin ParE1/3/4
VKQLRLLEHAEFDLDESAAWYDEQEPGIGEEFMTETRMAIRRILDNPDTYPIVRGNVRRFVMKRFPFLIYYTSDVNELTVLRVIHSSREPDEWKKRTK